MAWARDAMIGGQGVLRGGGSCHWLGQCGSHGGSGWWVGQCGSHGGSGWWVGQWGSHGGSGWWVAQWGIHGGSGWWVGQCGSHGGSGGWVDQWGSHGGVGECWDPPGAAGLRGVRGVSLVGQRDAFPVSGDDPYGGQLCTGVVSVGVRDCALLSPSLARCGDGDERLVIHNVSDVVHCDQCRVTPSRPLHVTDHDLEAVQVTQPGGQMGRGDARVIGHLGPQALAVQLGQQVPHHVRPVAAHRQPKGRLPQPVLGVQVQVQVGQLQQESDFMSAALLAGPHEGVVAVVVGQADQGPCLQQQTEEAGPQPPVTQAKGPDDGGLAVGVSHVDVSAEAEQEACLGVAR